MQLTLILLPAAAYILLTLLFAKGSRVKSIAEAVVKGHVVIFAFIAVATEVLSSIHAISFSALLVVWLLFLLCSLAAVVRRGRQRVFSLRVLKRIAPLRLILAGPIVLIVLSTFASAMLYPPNNWDSMTYHMARVVHWIGNQSVSFYPTAIVRQNFEMPLAEFAIMHIQILTGSDQYANLVQWMSFVVLICLGFLIADELGLSGRQQLTSAIAIATLPMGILQASSTQNDLVVAGFVVSFAFFMLRLGNSLGARNLLFCGISLGLALLSKGTAFLYCAAIGIALAIPLLIPASHDLTRLLHTTAGLFMVVIIALSINAGHFWRNYCLYGHPLSTEGGHLFNDEYSAAALVSNILRNGAMHLGTKMERVNSCLHDLLQAALGSELNNPKTTWRSTTFRIFYSRHEDLAGNLFHTLILLSGLVLLPFAWVQGRHRKAIGYAAGVLFGALLYCWLLRWEPWASKLHTPLFALAAPLLAIVIMPDAKGARRRLGYMLILFMILYSLPFAVANASRSLVSLEWKHSDRNKLYFANRPNLFSDYTSAVNMLKEADGEEVGLYLGNDDWEYPLWELTGRTMTNGKAMTFRHVGVSNISKRIEQETSLPAYVIATKPLKTWEYAQQYVSVYVSGSVSVFKRSELNNVVEPAGRAPQPDSGPGNIALGICTHLMPDRRSLLQRNDGDGDSSE